MKKILGKNIFLILIILLLMTICMPHKTYALDNIKSSAESFLNGGTDEEIANNGINEGKLAETSNYIYNILFTIAIVIAIAIGMIIGIQFMMAGVDEKAKIKETLIPYIIGVFVVFASFTIWKIVVEIGNDVSPTPTSSIQTQTTPQTGSPTTAI